MILLGGLRHAKGHISKAKHMWHTAAASTLTSVSAQAAMPSSVGGTTESLSSLSGPPSMLSIGHHGHVKAAKWDHSHSHHWFSLAAQPPRHEL